MLGWLELRTSAESKMSPSYAVKRQEELEFLVVVVLSYLFGASFYVETKCMQKLKCTTFLVDVEHPSVWTVGVSYRRGQKLPCGLSCMGPCFSRVTILNLRWRKVGWEPCSSDRVCVKQWAVP